jgi:hypothetical protein
MFTMADQYKFAFLILIITFLVNLVTYADFEKEISPRKFLRMFYNRSKDQAENLRLFIFQISFWMMVPILLLVHVATR